MQTFFVGLGGMLGAITRYIVSISLAHSGINLPSDTLFAGTLFANITGSFLLAFFVEWTIGKLAPDDHSHRLISTGFLGAYTTFSTYAVEAFAMIDAGNWINALLYISLTTVGCLISAGFGIYLGHRLKSTS